MHHVHVIFTGIIALILSAQPNGSMTAIAVNAPAGAVASDGSNCPPLLIE